MTEKKRDMSEGHRERLRQRFADAGFDAFRDYEVLEYLLFGIIPRKDTKKTAKLLIDKFGSFSEVFDAPAGKIAETEGIGRTSALALKAIREAMAFYFGDRAGRKKLAFDDFDSILAYLRAQLNGKFIETFLVIYLNSRNELIKSVFLTEGTINQASPFPRRIAEDSLRYNAVSAIIAHNHPGGYAKPSKEDIDLTFRLKAALGLFDVSLTEHIILTDEGYYSFAKNGYL